MIMDIKIVGLRLQGDNLDYLDLQEGHRFPGLRELDLFGTWHAWHEKMYQWLSTHNKDYLTTFVSAHCGDDDLAIIGQQCQNLEVLKITESDRVTDEGLRALNPCSNLRCVHFRQCPQVSHLGLNHLLSAHEKLEEIYYEPNDNFEELNFGLNIDVSSGLDLSVTVPSLKSLIFSIGQEDSHALNLSVIVGKFPNLINLEINCPDASNLSALKHMNKLTGLKIYFRNGLCNENLLQRTWEHIEEILAFIGPKITALTLWALHNEFLCRQDQLNMIYNRCPNLEQLSFDHADGILMVPEFKKLRLMAPRTSSTSSVCSLKFGTMSNLEILSLPYSEETIDVKTIEEMMFGNKFPRLSVLEMDIWGLSTYSSANRHRYPLISHSEQFEQIIKDNNLDFRIVGVIGKNRLCVFDHFPYDWCDHDYSSYYYMHDDSWNYPSFHTHFLCGTSYWNTGRLTQ